MSRSLSKLAVLILGVLATLNYAASQTTISAREATQHIGEYAKVCGQVASTHFAYRSRGAPTFVNIDEPYPNQIFTAVIWVEDRAKFGSPETHYNNQYICVRGSIESYRGKPEIVLRDPSQVELGHRNR